MTGGSRGIPAAAEQMIAALMPAPLPRSRPQPPPLPSLPFPCTSPAQTLPQLDIARLDQSGRVSARLLLEQLGWRPGQRLRTDDANRAVLIWPDDAGAPLVGARGDLTLPAAVRQMCAIETGGLVVLAADLDRGLLVVHPAETVARLLSHLHIRLMADGHGR
ncbi:hypothetical protein ACPPVO_22875 [Dactylosporangium sp. McL0621]|uniref:hypothetical protein n=1 Tax=Dactylosporangium sp. McL0621 TaxID=3415678 RepID=UPI003CE6BD6D